MLVDKITNLRDYNRLQYYCPKLDRRSGLFNFSPTYFQPSIKKVLQDFAAIQRNSLESYSMQNFACREACVIKLKTNGVITTNNPRRHNKNIVIVSVEYMWTESSGNRYIKFCHFFFESGKLRHQIIGGEFLSVLTWITHVNNETLNKELKMLIDYINKNYKNIDHKIELRSVWNNYGSILGGFFSSVSYPEPILVA